MGYGGSRKDAGKAIGKSGDEGIDGIIKEDRLGLDAVYLQAKRWKGTVGRPEIQAFAGSLEGHRARKGVFITTSQFSPDAMEYVNRIEKKIILIDGQQLASLSIEYKVGVMDVINYSVRKLDLDYLRRNEPPWLCPREVPFVVAHLGNGCDSIACFLQVPMAPLRAGGGPP
ncbi:MAG: restriction endonuclease [Candidatus Sulfotelmatobacter sp.]